MSDQSFPMDSGLWDIAEPFWPKADASGIREAHDTWKQARSERNDAAAAMNAAYRVVLDGFHADSASPPSDSWSPVFDRSVAFEDAHFTNEDVAGADDDAMSQAPGNIDDAKDQIAAEAHAAAGAISQNNSLIGTIVSNIPLIGQSNDDIKAKFKQRVQDIQQSYASKNEAVRGVPDYSSIVDVDGGDGGDPGMGGPVAAQNYSPSTGQPAQVQNLTPNTGQPVQVQNLTPNTGQPVQAQTSTPDTGQPVQDQATQQQGPTSSTPSGSPAGTSQGGSSSSPQGSPGGASAGAPGAGGTGAMHAAALEAPAPSAPAAQVSGAGAGGGAPAPSISGVGGVPGGTPAPSVAGAGGSSDGQGTRASGAQAAEKPAASSGSQSSGSQGSGVRGGGAAGAGAANAATSAQSAQQAALREAMRGDTAGGASGTGRHLDKQQDALGTGQGSGSSLAKLTLASLAASTAAMSASLEALPGHIVERNPFLSVGQAEARAWGGTLVTGGTVKGFGADGISWGDNPVADTTASWIGHIVLTYEDQTIAPNEEAGVFRPVLLEATSTEDFGVIRPEFDLPQGVRVMERGQSSGAPGQTWLVGHPGTLAVELVRWRIAQHEAGSKWRPVAVGFLGEADADTVYQLSQLGVESYWEGRPGFQLDNDDAEEKTKDATAQLAAGAAGAPKSLEELVKEDPKGDFDPAKLSGEHRGWHDERAATLGKDRLTNQEWSNELAWRKQQHGDNNGGGSFNF